MRGVKKGFVQIGESCYLREQAIAAVIFNPEVEYVPDGGGQESTVEVHLQGAESVVFEQPSEISQVREWVSQRKMSPLEEDEDPIVV